MRPESASLPDGRYSVALEHTGCAGPRHVLRFCGAFVGDFTTKADANTHAWHLHGERRSAMTYRERLPGRNGGTS